MRWSRKTIPLTRNVCLRTVFRQHKLRYTNSSDRGMRSRSLHHIADILCVPPHTQRTTLHSSPRTQPLIRRCNKPGSFTDELQNSIRSICHRAVSSRPARCRVAQQARVQTAHRLIIVFSKILKTYDSIMQRCRTLQNTIPLSTTKLALDYDQVRLVMPPPPFEGGGGITNRT